MIRLRLALARPSNTLIIRATLLAVAALNVWGCGSDSAASPKLTLDSDVVSPGSDVSEGPDGGTSTDSPSADTATGACTVDTDCPALATPCVEAACLEGGICGTRLVAAETACDDGVSCTVDACTDAGTCTHSPSDTACDDGLYCNGAEACGAAGCTTGASPCVGSEVCDEGLEACAPPECASDSDCAALTAGCVTGVCLTTGHCTGAGLPDGTACSDGDSLTFGETCLGSACAGGTSKACTTDAECAELATGCSKSLCNVAAGQCVSVPLPDGLACDDGRFCTESDSCVAGLCSGGARDCAAFAATCEVVSCDEVGKTCAHSPAQNGATCDDGAAATTDDACSAGLCQGVPTTCATDGDCDDHNACTADSCAGGQCAFASGNEGLACDDGNPCTVSESCSAVGVCAGGTQKPCDDEVACTSDVCSKVTGQCQHFVNAMACDNGVYCDGAEICTSTGCGNGAAPCAQGQACDEATDVCGSIVVDSADELAFQAALALYNAADYAGARTALETFVAKYPSSARLDNALFLIARCSFELGELTVALTQFQSFSATYPTSAFADDALYYVGRTSYDLSDFTAAVAAFQNFDQLYPTSPFIDNADYYLGRSYFALGQYPAAITAFAGVIALPTSTFWDAALLWTGRSELEIGKAGGGGAGAHFAAAETAFTDLVIKAPTSPYLDNAQFYYGLVAYYQGNSNETITRMQTLLATYPASTLRGGAQYYIGKSNYDATNYDVAVSELTLFTTTYPTTETYDDAARYYLGRALYNLGGNTNFTSAAAMFKLVYATHPTSIYADNAHYFAGRSYQRLAKAGANVSASYASAITEYEAVVTNFITSQYADNAYRYLVEIYSAQGNCPSAKTTFSAFQTAFPNSPELPKAQSAKTAAGC